MLVFEDLLHPGPDIVAAARATDQGFLFSPALDLADDGAYARVVLDRVVEFGIRVAVALSGLCLSNAPKQLGFIGGITVGVDLHGLKRELGLAAEHALRAAVREDLADGGGEVLDEFGDHCGGHPKTAGRTNTGGPVFF